MNTPLIYSPHYNTNLQEFGIDKPFALDRGEMVLRQLQKDFSRPISYQPPEPITDADILLVHSRRYFDSLKDPQTWLDTFEFSSAEYFPDKATRQLPELLDDIRLKCGGTLMAAELALSHGMAANLGGGYHHAFPDVGRGFCTLNDIAITARSLKKRGLVDKILIVDLDFHQGDGTALIFQDDPSVFTLSVHSEEGWPDEKQISTLDVPIREDEQHLYIDKMKAAIKTALSRFAPDLVLYVGGSDPYEKDVLPGTRFIKLSLETLKERDFFVIDTFADLKIPLASVFAGGYGPDVWEVHYWATRRMLERSELPIGSTISCN